MNCKPGDLAVVVGPCDIPEVVGRIFKVTSMDEDFPGCWKTDPRQSDALGREIVFNDRCLRPIRPRRQFVTEGRETEVTA